MLVFRHQVQLAKRWRFVLRRRPARQQTWTQILSPLAVRVLFRQNVIHQLFESQRSRGSQSYRLLRLVLESVDGEPDDLLFCGHHQS